MALGFAYTAPDYATRAVAGVPMDPNAPDQSVMPAAPPVPQAATQGQPEPYKPNFLDILQGVVFNGQSPADAAMAARGRDFALQQQRYGIQRQQMLMETLRAATPDQRLAMLLNPNELGKAVASRFSSIALKGGETRDNGQGGGATTAPLVGLDKESGKDYAILPGKMISSGQSLGGDISVSPTGIVNSARTGPTGQAVSLPQLKPVGSSLESFTPGISEGGVPATPGAPATPSVAGASNLPRGIRNMNFGNVRPLPNGQQWAGQTGVDTDGYAIFATPQDGLKAAATNLQAYAAKGINTLNGIVSTWAPKGDGPNDPVAYAHYLAGKLGVDPNEKLDLSDKTVQQNVLRGIFDFENGPKAMAAWRHPVATGGGATIRTLSPATPPAILDPNDPANAADYKNVPVGTVLQRAPDGTKSVLHEAEYSPSVRSEIRGKFLSSDPYSQHIAAASALKALQHNIGQMTGPAAYTILDTMARTINPGAVARQGTISAIEGMMGVPAHVVGTLQNYVGEGKIPLASQQAILNAVTPFAQAHYDEAKRLFDANAAIARAHKFAPEELTAPLGERPSPMFVAVPAAGQRQAGAVYATPKGPMKWTGTGWRPAN